MDDHFGLDKPLYGDVKESSLEMNESSSQYALIVCSSSSAHGYFVKFTSFMLTCKLVFSSYRCLHKRIALMRGGVSLWEEVCICGGGFCGLIYA